MTAAVILAAGASSRLGEPKQLVTLAGETLLERALRCAKEAGCNPVIVVLGAEAERILSKTNLQGVRVIVNDQWPEGIASSIRAGVAAASDSASLILMACDQPAVTGRHLRNLAAHDTMAASIYVGRKGIPAYFPASSFKALMQLSGDHGARELLRCAPGVELQDGELDIDTGSELAAAIERFE